MISLPVVRPFLKNDAMNLVAYFVTYGYMEENGVFYVALENNEGNIVDVTNDIDYWNVEYQLGTSKCCIWQMTNDKDLKSFI